MDMKPEWHRPMKLKVVEWNQHTGYHACLTPDGARISVDLTVDGSLPESWSEHPETLVGGYVQVDYIHPHAFIAMEVSVAIPD